MITLAFAQMLYFLFVSLRAYTARDGIALWTRSHAAGSLDLEDQRSFYWLCLGPSSCSWASRCPPARSPFGRVLRGAKENERRMAALGFPVLRYRLAAYVVSGAVTGAAGAAGQRRLLPVGRPS